MHWLIIIFYCIFQLRERPLIEKFYEAGHKFLTMFPDGTGNVLYPCPNMTYLVACWVFFFFACFLAHLSHSDKVSFCDWSSSVISRRRPASINN